VTLKLGDPLVIYSRFDLNNMLLERAERAGAQIEKTRVTGMTRQGAGMPGMNNPHGGTMAAPGAGGKMPAPEDLPPAGKKK